MSQEIPDLYRYRPLPATHFRVIDLFRGADNEPLRCTLRECEDASITPYEALSYAWGARTKGKCLYVSDATFEGRIEITDNLFDALQELRRRIVGQRRTLWIDAVCVNQGNDEEKSDQVSRMGQIYSNASCVRVWLGTTKWRTPVNQLLEEITALADVSKWSWFGTLGEGIQFLRKLDRLRATKLFDCSWFFRIWIIQEFILAKEVTFHFGRNEIQYPLFRRALGVIYRVLDSSQFFRNHQNAKEHLAIAHKRIRLIQDLFEVRASIERKEQLPLIRCVLDLARERSCTDDRDRVYGLLGITQDQVIIPNYQATPREVYWDFFKANLDSGDLSVLHECCIGHLIGQWQSFMPVLNLSTDNITYPISVAGRNFTSGAAFPVQAEFIDNLEVRLKGVRVEGVLRYVHFGYDIRSTLGDGLQWVRKYPPGIDARDATDEYIPIGLSARFDRRIRPILKHLYKQDTSNRASFYTERDWYRNLAEYSVPPYHEMPFYTVLQRTLMTDAMGEGSYYDPITRRISEIEMLMSKCLFVTTSGYLGLGTCHLRPGDQIVIFDGDTTPFILREELDHDMATGRYQIVGDCYLYGWMYGDYFGHCIMDDGIDVTPDRKGHFAGSSEATDGGKEESTSATTDPPLRERVLHKEIFAIC